MFETAFARKGHAAPWRQEFMAMHPQLPQAEDWTREFDAVQQQLGPEVALSENQWAEQFEAVLSTNGLKDDQEWEEQFNEAWSKAKGAAPPEEEIAWKDDFDEFLANGTGFENFNPIMGYFTGLAYSLVIRIQWMVLCSHMCLRLKTPTWTTLILLKKVSRLSKKVEL
jgi:hypothetical protein